MIGAPGLYGGLSRALAPPGGDARAFEALDLRPPDPRRLEEEHTALFGRAGRAILSPYEGVHRGTGIHEIMAAYAAGGFAPAPSFRDRPDHVCVELAFLEGLGRREERARRDRDRPAADRLAACARTFFVDHVWTWVPAFFDSMAGEADFPLHRSLARRALRSLRREAARAQVPCREEPADAAPPAPVLCTECGAPTGVSLPERGSLPTEGLVCLTCRLRADLRRSQS